MVEHKVKGVRLPVFGAFLLLLLLSQLMDGAMAAHTRFVSSGGGGREPHYDRSITTFSSEGRLLQVEYGIEAASLRGSTAAAIRCDDGTLLLVVKSSSSSSTSTSTGNNNNNNNKVYRIDDHVFLVATGLVGDARFVADRLRRYCQSVRTNYGEAPTLHEVAEHAASWQHTLTRMEGARPLACTCIVVGVDPTSSTDAAGDDSQQGLGATRIFRTGPGGSLQEYRYCAAGKGQDQAMKALAVEMGKQHQQRTKSSKSTNDSNSKKDNQVAASTQPFVKAVLPSFDLKNDETVDVWTIRPELRRRGNLHATCFQGVTKNNLQQMD